MQYRETSSFNDVGGRRVGEALAGEARSLGYRVVDNVLLDAGDDTGYADHIVIDRHGLMVVAVESYDAEITGRSTDGSWTAKCANGRIRFSNPLLRNDRMREVLQRVLIASGRNLPAEYVQSLVVFGRGRLGRLKLTDVDSMRVIAGEQVLDFMRARYDFAPNPGALDQEQIGDLVSLMQSLNRSTDPDAVARHAESETKGRVSWLRTKQRQPREIGLSTRVLFEAGRYPDGSELSPPPAARRTSPTLLALLLALLLAASALVYVYGGVTQVGDAIFQTVDEMMGRDGASSQQQPLPVVGRKRPQDENVNAIIAAQRLRETAPDIYEQISTPMHPQVSVVNGRQTFTWQYAGKGNGSLRSISITLDTRGEIVGVSQRQ